MKFHSTGLSYMLAVIVLIIYIFFITSSMGVSGLLLSFAIGMIAAAFIEPLELVVAIVIVAGIVLTVVSKQLFIQQILAGKTEGFEAGMGTGKSISDRVVSLEEGTYKLPPNRPRVKAVYSEIGFGYAPVQSTEGFQSTPNEDDEEGEEAESTPAPKSEAANPTKLVDKDASAVQAAATATPDTTSTVPGGGGKMLPLYGRRSINGSSDRWNYYTRTNEYNPVPLPLRHKNRDCMDDIGCPEVFSGDSIHVDGTGEKGLVRLFNMNGPRYFPGYT